MELWIGIGLAVLGIVVAAWDGWLTLRVNRNVVAMRPDRVHHPKAKSQILALPCPAAIPALPERASPAVGPSLRQAAGLPASKPAAQSPPQHSYYSSKPDPGEGRKMLEVGLSYLQAGNPSLALPFLYQSMEILSEVGTQREIVAARMAIESAQNSSLNFFRRTANAGSYRPKPDHPS